jgi:hypothetical protein
MTIRKRPVSRSVSSARYTPAELAAADEADRLADLRWEAERPAREAAEREEAARKASLTARLPSYTFVPERGKITIYKGWEIEHDKHGWCVHYPDSGGGKYLATLREAKRYIDNY